MGQQRVVVIGGGVIGACTAHSLARRGRSVTIVESKRICGRDAASFGNAGLISVGHLPLPRPGLLLKSLRWMFDKTSPLLIVPRMDPALLWWLVRFGVACRHSALEANMRCLGEMSTHTIAQFDRYAHEFGIQFEYRTGGYMDVFRTDETLDHARNDVAMVNALGIREEIIGGGEARALEPALLPGVAGAVLRRDAAFANPRRFVTGVVESARRLGAELVEDDPVVDVAFEGRRAKAVITESGRTIDGDVVVLAAGSWSTALGKRIGVSVPMQPAKGYHAMVEQPEPTPLKMACSLGEAFVAATPMDGQVRLAGTLELSGLNLDMRPERVEMLVPGAARYIEGIGAGRVVSTWCGLRPCTADGLPVVGWAPRAPGVFVATGHAMMGFWLGPVSGELAAQMICGEPPMIDPAPLSAARFR